MAMTEYDIVLRVVAALLAGGLVGFERTFHGRAAGMRTYALVSFGSALLVAAALSGHLSASASGDATRVIQGIVTGIGFLGAGVIVKEGFTIHGLTTAASIWVAAAIGVVFGGGLFLSGAVATALTLMALAMLRMVEDRLPVQNFAHCEIAFARDRALDEDWLRELLRRNGFSITELCYRLNGSAGRFEYAFIAWSVDPNATRKLERELRAQSEVVDFRISPSRD
jgi:putative Mg2+ transporter-C (MgtC) family protein